MLVEMGFVSNPKEYDNLRSGDSLFYTANAVADAILSEKDLKHACLNECAADFVFGEDLYNEK